MYDFKTRDRTNSYIICCTFTMVHTTCTFMCSTESIQSDCYAKKEIPTRTESVPCLVDPPDFCTLAGLPTWLLYPGWSTHMTSVPWQVYPHRTSVPWLVYPYDFCTLAGLPTWLLYPGWSTHMTSVPWLVFPPDFCTLAGLPTGVLYPSCWCTVPECRSLLLWPTWSLQPVCPPRSLYRLLCVPESLYPDHCTARYSLGWSVLCNLIQTRTVCTETKVKMFSWNC